MPLDTSSADLRDVNFIKTNGVTYSVIAFPPLFCGKCGRYLHQDGHFHRGKPVVARCLTVDCEQYDVPLLIPETRIEVQRAADAAP